MQMENEVIRTTPRGGRFIEHMLPEQIQNILLPHPPTPEIREMIRDLRNGLNATRSQGERPFESENSQYEITLANNQYYIRIFKNFQPRGRITVVYVGNNYNQAQFRTRLREIREIIEDVAFVDEEEEEEVLAVPTAVAKGLFELKSKISRAEPTPARTVGQYTIPARNLEQSRHLQARQPINFQPFALACVIKKLQEQYPIQGGQWKWVVEDGWMWNSGLDSQDPAFSIEFRDTTTGPFATEEARKTILSNPTHPQRGALEEHILSHLVVSRPTNLHVALDTLHITAQTYLDILTECSKENPIKQITKREEATKSAVEVVKGTRRTDDDKSIAQIFRSQLPESMPNLRQSANAPPEIARTISDFLTEKGPKLTLKKTGGGKRKAQRHKTRRS